VENPWGSCGEESTFAACQQKTQSRWQARAGFLTGRVHERIVSFDPSEGWVHLVLEIHSYLLTNPEYRVNQVKEKFGELRFYASGLSKEEKEHLKGKEEESLTICQECGSSGAKLRNRGWLATLCDPCDEQAHPTRGYGKLTA